jgi:hypothetical protein
MTQAIRIVDQNDPPAIGSYLPHSWHNHLECDWIEDGQDIELDGTCGFEVQTPGDPASMLSALGFAGSQWPGKQLIALIEGLRGESDVPEDGGISVRGAQVLALFWWDI